MEPKKPADPALPSLASEHPLWDELPPALSRQALAILNERKRTVWDARRLLSRFKDRWMRLEVDDGQFSHRLFEAIFDDVYHHPDTGFSLSFRRFKPARRPGDPGCRKVVPISLIRRLPRPFGFLFHPRSQWPMPDPLVACSGSGCGHVTSGRFCESCGTVVRKGAGHSFLGEGFAAIQVVLQKQDAERCRCGAALLPGLGYCPKCGLGGDDAE